MNYLLKITAFIIVTLFISNCSADLYTKPLVVNTNPPPGPYNYRKGWKDGCESALSATNNFFQVSLGTHRFALDSRLINDRLYNQAWRYAFNHCGFSMRTLDRYEF